MNRIKFLTKKNTDIYYIFTRYCINISHCIYIFSYRDEYPILLVANKVDLVHLRKISEKEGRAMADRLNLPYMETSAKDPPQNIDGAFHEVSYFIIETSLIIK